MATDVTMPRLSDSMEEGTVLKWLVEEGGEVKRGEPLVEIETDKANMTYEADTDGTLIEIVAQEGDTLAIGEVIARIGDPSEAGENGEEGQAATRPAEEGDRRGGRPRPEEPTRAKARRRRRRGEEPRSASRRRGQGRGGPRRETAAARRRPGHRPGAPPNGDGGGSRPRRSRAGWRASWASSWLGSRARAPAGGSSRPTCRPPPSGGAAAKRRPTARGREAEAPRGARAEPAARRGRRQGRGRDPGAHRLQQTVSRRMAESKATAPDFSISLTVDMTKAVELRERLKEVADPAPSFNDMVVKAAATALREHPRVNGAYRDGKFELYERVNVGVAVAAQDALVVPTVFDADRKSLGQIARDARALIEKVRDKSITPPGAVGRDVHRLEPRHVRDRAVHRDHQPAAGRDPDRGQARQAPAVDESGRIVARDQMTLSLVCDHRILYGADGAQFLARVKELLEQPLSLAL